MRKEQFSVTDLTLGGVLKDKNGNIFLAFGTTVPADNSKGYAKGCIFIDTDATDNGFYINTGTPTACAFKLVTVAI